MRKRELLGQFLSRHEIRGSDWLATDRARCVQCGICSYSCPAGIDVRYEVWKGKPISNSQCLGCGQCATRCPRGVLSFGDTDILQESITSREGHVDT